MGLFLRKEDSRTELQARVAAELQDRLREEQPSVRAEDTPSTMTENQHQTRPIGFVLAALAVVAIIVVAIAVS